MHCACAKTSQQKSPIRQRLPLVVAMSLTKFGWCSLVPSAFSPGKETLTNRHGAQVGVLAAVRSVVSRDDGTLVVGYEAGRRFQILSLLEGHESYRGPRAYAMRLGDTPPGPGSAVSAGSAATRAGEGGQDALDELELQVGWL
jgi:hypothetical protein